MLPLFRNRFQPFDEPATYLLTMPRTPVVAPDFIHTATLSGYALSADACAALTYCVVPSNVSPPSTRPAVQAGWFTSVPVRPLRDASLAVVPPLSSKSQ